MYENDLRRTASSELINLLLGETKKYSNILRSQKERLQEKYPDPTLTSFFEGMESRIISIAPMVLFDKMLEDLGFEPEEELLEGLGLMLYAVSTHDDVVDERPTKRLDVAGLIYAGDITTLEGMRILMDNAPREVLSTIIDYLNLTNHAQTKIVRDLWQQPTDEEVYLEAINTTRYWAEAGLQAAVTYAKRPDLRNFADQFSIYYGKTCQIFDDVREIDDDLRNGYWSLPISLAQKNNWDLSTPEGRSQATVRSREIARDYIQRSKDLCSDDFPSLKQLVEQISIIGFSIKY